MARPKLPTTQRKVMTMTVRMRQDLDEGLAAVALLRGTTKSGLVSQYAAEQIRLERERDKPSFDAAVKEVKQQREARRAKRAAQARLESPIDALDHTNANTERWPLAKLERRETSPNVRAIEFLSDAAEMRIQGALGAPSLLTRQTTAANGSAETLSSEVFRTPERSE